VSVAAWIARGESDSACGDCAVALAEDYRTSSLSAARDTVTAGSIRKAVLDGLYGARTAWHAGLVTPESGDLLSSSATSLSQTLVKILSSPFIMEPAVQTEWASPTERALLTDQYLVRVCMPRQGRG
jgi:hypothetical protein